MEESKNVSKSGRSKSLPFAFIAPKEPPLEFQPLSDFKFEIKRNKTTNFSQINRDLQIRKNPPIKKPNLATKAEQELEANKKKTDWRTLQQHYYPEGGWGWIVLFSAFITQILSHGTQIIISNILIHRFKQGWLGAASLGISLFLSPIWISICKRKSTRLAAVFGGLVASLGCLFTSFASQFHQLFISYGAFIGVGVGLTRDASSLMVGQYFKRKREMVEIFVVSGSGLGILIMSISIHSAISSLGWRIGLQAITAALFLTFFLGTCYRSASLYHPQRRAILHLKNQKRKVKEKEKREDNVPFLDISCLQSKTLRILILSSALTSFGISTPLFYLSLEYETQVEPHSITNNSLILLHGVLGGSWVLGCISFGLILIQKNQDCRISKQYLTQISGLFCSVSILALVGVEGYNGLLIFSCIYGFCLGSYNYSLKIYTYERVRARHFPRAWSFIQCAQSIPLFLGVPITGYLNDSIGSKSGYYFSAVSVFIGSVFLFLTDVRRRRLSRRKAQNSSMKTCETLESAQSPKVRRLSFGFPPEPQSPKASRDNNGEEENNMENKEHEWEEIPSPIIANNKELTCISEEGNIDLQDLYYEEWGEIFGDITSCNKVENCLVSEFDPELVLRPRRWSGARPSLASATAGVASGIAGLSRSSHRYLPQNSRNIIQSVIHEADSSL